MADNNDKELGNENTRGNEPANQNRCFHGLDDDPTGEASTGTGSAIDVLQRPEPSLAEGKCTNVYRFILLVAFV
jgi:hypothetical protein